MMIAFQVPPICRKVRKIWYVVYAILSYGGAYKRLVRDVAWCLCILLESNLLHHFLVDMKTSDPRQTISDNFHWNEIFLKDRSENFFISHFSFFFFFFFLSLIPKIFFTLFVLLCWQFNIYTRCFCLLHSSLCMCCVCMLRTGW